MSYDAKIIADSVASGVRLTTMQITYPRYIHAEMMTHRVFSRNSSSSRAIPIRVMVEQVLNDPVMPIFTTTKAGMQGGALLEGYELNCAKQFWLEARDIALVQASHLGNDCHVHKQTANRLLEPWMWITVCITSTYWAQFFKQRCHPDAQPEMQKIANLMREVYTASRPKQKKYGEWHLPYVNEFEEYDIRKYLADKAEMPGYPDFRERMVDKKEVALCLAQLSVARAARTSYNRQEDARSIADDLKLFHEKLVSGGHWSPFEHAAQVVDQEEPINLRQYTEDYLEIEKSWGNLAPGWKSMRYMEPYASQQFVEDEGYWGPYDET